MSKFYVNFTSTFFSQENLELSPTGEGFTLNLCYRMKPEIGFTLIKRNGRDHILPTQNSGYVLRKSNKML